MVLIVSEVHSPEETSVLFSAIELEGYRWNSPCFPSLLSALCNRYDPKSRIQNDGEEVLGWSVQPAKAPPKVILARERTYQRNLSWRGRPHIACQAVRWPVPKHNSSLSNLVGFTAAWSSVREPALVFQLLQTIFYEFDTRSPKNAAFSRQVLVRLHGSKLHRFQVYLKNDNYLLVAVVRFDRKLRENCENICIRTRGRQEYSS